VRRSDAVLQLPPWPGCRISKDLQPGQRWGCKPSAASSRVDGRMRVLPIREPVAHLWAVGDVAGSYDAPPQPARCPVRLWRWENIPWPQAA